MRWFPWSPRLSTIVVLVTLVTLGGCGGSSAKETRGPATCGPDTEQPLDPGSIQHLLPGAPEPQYSSEPPTSGPHVAGGAPTGAVSSPVARPLQVAVLEAGGVMIQYRGLTGPDQRRLRTLAERTVVVAPSPILRSPVIATAWLHRIKCGDVSNASIATITAFVNRHKGKGPSK